MLHEGPIVRGIAVLGCLFLQPGLGAGTGHGAEVGGCFSRFITATGPASNVDPRRGNKFDRDPDDGGCSQPRHVRPARRARTASPSIVAGTSPPTGPTSEDGTQLNVFILRKGGVFKMA